MPESTDKWHEARRRALAYADSLTDEEDARITAAALADPDAQPWTDEMWAKAVTFDEWQKRRAQTRDVAREAARAAAAATAQSISLEIDGDVLEHFRKTGPGWPARINEALRKAAGLG